MINNEIQFNEDLKSYYENLEKEPYRTEEYQRIIKRREKFEKMVRNCLDKSKFNAESSQ